MDRKCVLGGAFVSRDASAPNGKCRMPLASIREMQRKGSRISLDSLEEIKCREKSGASDGRESVTGYQTSVFQSTSVVNQNTDSQ